MIVRGRLGGQVFHHVVSFRFNSEVTQAQVEDLTLDLERFAATLSGLRSYACGTDLGLRGGNADYAVAAIFETEDALKGYLDHPVHRDIVARHIVNMVTEKQGVQFAITKNKSNHAVDSTTLGETE